MSCNPLSAPWDLVTRYRTIVSYFLVGLKYFKGTFLYYIYFIFRHCCRKSRQVVVSTNKWTLSWKNRLVPRARRENRVVDNVLTSVQSISQSKCLSSRLQSAIVEAPCTKICEWHPLCRTVKVFFQLDSSATDAPTRRKTTQNKNGLMLHEQRSDWHCRRSCKLNFWRKGTEKGCGARCALLMSPSIPLRVSFQSQLS